jgi:prepilin-type N-terminal cleavage/methylation domain-containing protein
VLLGDDSTPAGSQRGRQGGFTLIELVIVVAILCILAAIFVANLKRSIVKDHISDVAAEARQVHQAFQQYHRDHGMYPNASDPPALNLRTLSPLPGVPGDGTHDAGNVVEHLLRGRADAYDSPDDRGNNQEFWLELTLEADPSIRFLIAESDNAPLGGGQWREGVFMYRNGILAPIDSRL